MSEGSVLQITIHNTFNGGSLSLLTQCGPTTEGSTAQVHQCQQQNQPARQKAAVMPDTVVG
uniref:Uncharacterized protein n=1 Tax=Arundo donax TaxID=35708 RepID=A0A0A9AW77_ARUDO